jgi:hypothetical protein
MYIWTIVIAGLFGLMFIFAPETVKSMYNESCDPLPYGMLGSIFLAFGLMAILGLRAPVKFVPVLLMQLAYKVIWFIGVVLPFLIAGRATPDILTVVIFALTIVGDLIAIPFSYVLAKGSGA